MVLHKLFLFSLLALLPLQTATNSKQELNDQLYEAVRKGDVAAVTAALDRGADVNAKFRYGATALFKAAERGHTAVAKVLLDRGADVKVKDTFYGATAMTWALDNDHLEIVKMLLAKGGGDVDEVLQNGARGGNPELVKIALAQGGATDTTMTAALAMATANEKGAEIVEMLKKAGAKPPLEVDPATLQKYAGKYRGDPGPELNITFKDGKLFAALGRDSQPLMALDNTTFRPVAFGNITLVFNVEGDKATSMTFKQGTNTSQLKRIE
ncbi:MAG TPA: ankyrin repeat domain-containing protein [Pyrinomonadaceae bacterium]|jgi:ankyrin repeat protein|nr:ankyrin repeat domain-containing protein [Pyrinomonadaceae bacterium]